MSTATSLETGGESKPLVHIVLADRGWILEQCAYEITKRFDYVSVGDKPDPAAPINYYVNYHAFQGKQPGIDIGFFTHIEPKAASVFIDTAKQLDASICMSSIYADELEKAGVRNIYLISPGVDFDKFKPVLRIGIVGRTYKTGRKGEDLVRSVMDEPGIDWHFTGEGWPGLSIMYSAEEMPNFYNNIDYLLIPSNYEGGPLSLLEALACGREVIAPPIGFVSDYPHIEYKTGDSEDLRLVLKELVKQRTQLRESVLEKSWATWASAHDILFREILKKNDFKLPVEQKKTNFLLAMGTEEKNSRGGPSVRIAQFNQQLHQLGFKADISTEEQPDVRPYDLVHVFNNWPPESTLSKLKYLQTQTIPIVFSPIFLNLSELLWANEVIPTIFQPGRSANEIDADIAAILTDDYLTEKRSKYKNMEFLPGYFSQIKEMIAASDYIIGLSDSEIESLKSIAGEIKPSCIVRNTIDFTPYQSANATEFYEKYHIRDYVLCVGRIESRKNQLMLIHALGNTAIPIVLIGQETDEPYSQLVHSFAGENVHFIGEIPHDSTLLASAFAGAKVFCLPSWSEGAPIAALEAAACGIPMILSNRSGEIEYFGSAADYCDPMNPTDIRNKILQVFESDKWKKSERLQLQQRLQTQQTIENFAKETVSSYDLASEEFEKRIINQITYPGQKKTAAWHDSANISGKVDQADSARLQTELADVRAELNSIRDERDQIQTDLNSVREERDQIQIDLNSVRDERDQIQAELNITLSERDRIWHELDSTVHSKSYRITIPFREAAGVFRKLAGTFTRSLNKPKSLAFSVIHFIRMLPLVSSLADAVKKTFPRLWARLRFIMLREGRQTNLSSTVQMYQDKQYFLNLFQDEIAKRKHSSKESS